MKAINTIKQIKVRWLLSIVGFLYCTTICAYDFEVGGIYYNKISDNKVEVYGSGSISGKLTLPERITVNGVTYSVTAIGDDAFEGRTALTSVTIPNSVTSIGNYAFFSCSGLTSVTIGNSVTSIGERAFYGCSRLTSVTIPNSVTSIGRGAFGDCSGLTSVTIPNSVTSIGNEAFMHCSGLTSLTIPNSVTSIGNRAFFCCSGLTSISVERGNSNYDSRDNCNAIIEIATNVLIAGCMNTIIPNSVTSIGESAFYKCSGLTSVTIPNSVTSIGESAFSYCSGLTSLTIPNSVTTIGEWAFYKCSGLTSVTIGNSVTSIGDYAFADCSGLTSVTIGNSVTSIGYHAFSGCSNLTSVTIPNSVTSIGYAAFEGCSGLTSVTIGNSVTSIGGSAFAECNNLKSVYSKIQVPFSLSVNVFSKISNVAVLYVPVGTKSKYTSMGWTKYFSEVIEEEDTAPNTHSLSITSSGNGSATYSGTTIKNGTKTFTVNEGTSATVSFTPDSGHRIASVKVNNTDVTANVTNNKYTISNIKANTTLSVTFEAIPPTTYTLSIQATGNGSATYSGTTIRNQTRSFTVNEGTSATVSFAPDSGQRIASVKVNNTDVTANVTNNKYTISNIKSNTTLSVTFEALPPTTYTLSILATGNGSATYNGTAVRNRTYSFTVKEGTSATVIFTPDSGNRIASVKVNNQDVTAKVANNRYTITNITSSTTVVVNFEEIPPTPVTTYSLSVSSSGGGYALYNGATIRNQTRTFTLDEGTSATISFTPDSGNRIASVKVNNQDVTASVANYQYTISSIAADTKLEVTFEEIVNALVNDDVNYSVVSQDDKTVRVSAGKYGQVLTVPESFVKNGVTWTVTGIETNALKDNADLAAIVWNPNAAFTGTVSNPNLLLYVKDAQYAPGAVKNVVVNGTANSITLVDAENGNNFYCPQQFLARNISYIHHYGMATGIGESRGWETISLPFDVQTVTHATKGSIVPFATWTSGDAVYPFWLYELNGTGWAEAQGIKAYTPYIISMPNNSKYKSQFQLAGNVTFAASNVTVGKTEDLHTATYSGRTFTPTFSMKENGEGLYALNVNNDFISDNSGMTEGSRFVLNMRKVHPFEAYMTSALQARQFFEVFETGTEELDKLNVQQLDYCYDLAGRKIVNSKSQNSKMPKGVYIMNGKKIIIK